MAYAETYSLCCIVSKGLIMFYGYWLIYG
jgi:hypothetical protein